MEKKTAVVSKNANVEKKPSAVGSLFATIVIPLALFACVLIYMFVLGNPANFEGNDPANHPLPGNWLGIVYKGGWVVPVLLSLNLMVFIFAIERALTIGKAKGTKNVANFVRTISAKLTQRDVNGAIAACDVQKGSVANVVKAGLLKYKEMQNEPELLKAEKVAAIQKEIEESTSLELPMLEKNLVVISTIASTSTLVGLIGTVLGMIKAFSALATAGAPDSVALANGISEALINTALGITGSTIAIVAYNYFTSKIDELTYSIDEAGFSMVSTFTAQHDTAPARPQTV
ncbi:outer membrane transport energization protein ExbB [Pontibacter mucosus]|uniref:Outer membrane transport energization protein ExbB n=2 Tax=Pontibacter TaxID=323449 RepID=A0A1I2YRW0_9BACT|nr:MULTISPECIES: MotA/TolQ/ExbB proton channel family protein [Pontibacter]PTX22806.1 outer membrane transport energization protein ExbB [Pontibacter mucosus]SFH27826.1 outer membrane transport energization protein ExbB [Pontibacter chinhatensis]